MTKRYRKFRRFIRDEEIPLLCDHFHIEDIKFSSRYCIPCVLIGRSGAFVYVETLDTKSTDIAKKQFEIRKKLFLNFDNVCFFVRTPEEDITFEDRSISHEPVTMESVHEMAVKVAEDQVVSLSTLMALKKHLESLEKYRKKTIERGGITYELHSVGTPFGLSFKEEYFPVAEDDPVKFLLIALLGGVFGAHKFVAGQWAAGFFYLLTCGGFAIFHGFDVLSIVSGTYYIKQISYTEDEDTVRRITERIYLKKPPRWASALGIVGLIIPTCFAFLLYIKVFIPTLTYIGSLLLGAL